MPRSAPTSTTCSTSCRDPPGPPRRRSGESSSLPRTCCTALSSSSIGRRSTPARGGPRGFARSSTGSPMPRSSQRCTAHRPPASTSTSSCAACARSGRASPACRTASASSASSAAFSGWLVRRPEAGAVLATLALASLPPAVPGAAPQCRQPHYRWTQKTDTSLAALSPHPTSVTAILAGWAAPNIASRDRCAPRADRELQVFALTGWVRRVEKVKDDGDWHIELTEGAASPVDSCVVVEIPAPKYGSRYALARAALDSLLGG